MLKPKHLIPIGLAHIFILVLVSSGAREKSLPSPTNSTDVPHWRWEVFAAVQRMRLAALPCQLLPRSSISIYSPMVGVLRVYAAQPQTNLTGNVVWGEFEPAMFAAEAKAIDEAKTKL